MVFFPAATLLVSLILKREDERLWGAIALHESEENLRITLDSIGDAIISTDTDGRIVLFNPVAQKLTGFSLQEAVGRDVYEVFNIVKGETNEPAENPVKSVLEEGKVVGLAHHTVLISKDGKEYQIADSGSPIKDDDGNITGVVLVFRDMTESYQMHQKLKENEKKYRQLFENMSNGVGVYEAVDDGDDFVFVDFNEAAEEIDDINREGVIGKRVTEVFPGVEEFGLFDVFKEVWRTGESQYHPTAMYEYERIVGWRENWV
ncbi:MAG: PAS domain S-box protein, partial [Chloroflexota bacterium]|nr:PAS domain S-box protein [Chloroflexota bacterium]